MAWLKGVENLHCLNTNASFCLTVRIVIAIEDKVDCSAVVSTDAIYDLWCSLPLKQCHVKLPLSTETIVASKPKVEYRTPALKNK